MQVLDHQQDLRRHYGDIAAIYESNGWGTGYDAAVLDKMFAATIHRVAVVDGVAVGLLRAHGDHVVATYLTELAIHKDHQRKGYGTALLEAFLKDVSGTAVYVLALSDSKTFFDRFGLPDRSDRFVVYGRGRVA